MVKKKSLNKRGFTLVELLIVVAIMGILAAVGVVSYTGFMESARENASRANHSTAVSYMQAEVTKCQIANETLQLVDSLNVPAPFNCTNATTPNDFQIRFIEHFIGVMDNPHNQAINVAVDSAACPGIAGQMGFTSDANTTTIRTRWSADMGEACEVGVISTR